MSIQFQCPKCQSVRSTSLRLVGKQIRCPECDYTIQLPTQKELDRAAEEARAAEQAKKAIKPPAVKAPMPSPPPQQREPMLEPSQDEIPFKKSKNRDECELDMTPMVDVTFLLLIFFMITASFSIQKVFTTPAQKSNEASTNAIPDPDQDNADAVIVQIDEFNAYTVIIGGDEKEVASKQDLIVLLNEAKGGSGDQGPQKLIVEAHEESIHSAVVAAIDAGRDAKFEKFEVVSVEQFD